MGTGESFETACPYRSGWEVIDAEGNVHLFDPDWTSYQSARDEANSGQIEVRVAGRWETNQKSGYVKFTKSDTGWTPLKATDQ